MFLYCIFDSVFVMLELKENILATLAYYDIFDFPLKTEEIFERLTNFKHLYISTALQLYSYKEIQKGLDQLVIDRAISIREGYYFLDDREYLVPLRLKREKIAKRKWRIAKRVIWRLRFVPYLRAVFASGSLAMRNTDELSDLDVLIVVRPGRIWLTRLLITAMLSILRVRRRGRDRIAPDKICLNHYITDKSLRIPFKSIYTAQTYTNLASMYVSDQLLIENFMNANEWVLDYVYSWNIKSVCTKSQQTMLARAAEWFLEILGWGHFFNKMAGQYQSKRIAKNPVTTQMGGRVIFNDDQLEFHPHSIEIKIIQSYNERLNLLGLSEFAIEKNSGLDRVVL